MTGVGEFMQLFSYHSSKKEKKQQQKQQERQRLLFAEDAEEYDGIAGWDDEGWHDTIVKEDWDTLRLMLNDFDHGRYKPKKEYGKKKRRLRIVKTAIWLKDNCCGTKCCLRERKRGDEDEEGDQIPPSPLMGLDKEGHTPLHLAVGQCMVPNGLCVRLLFSDRRAARVRDQEGRLPLHICTLHNRSVQLLDRCIRAFVPGLQSEDGLGKTALFYCVQSTIREKIQNADGEENINNHNRSYWGIPRDPDEAAWQEHQERLWNKVRFLLLTYSTRKKVLTKSERDVLLQALEEAAPPSTIEVVLFASQVQLKTDPTLAIEALKIFMKRQYPIKNLQLLLYHFPIQHIESIDSARKLLTSYYHEGCKPREGRELSFRAEMEQCALENVKYRPTLACREWWDKIKCLLRLCGHQNEKEQRSNWDNKHLLHAALSNCDTPPSLVQLLMALSPDSIHLSHPYNEGANLLQLICRNWKYNLFPQSKIFGYHAGFMEEPPMEQVLRIICAVDPTKLRSRYEQRLPLHHAIVTGKSQDFLEVLIEYDPQALTVRDPITKLYPYQTAALKNFNKNAALWAHARYSPMEWKYLTPEERSEAVDEVLEQQDLDHLSNTYTLLRGFPAAIDTATVLRKPAEFRDHDGKGLVSAHYHLYCYIKDEEYGSWDVRDDECELLEEACDTGTIPAQLEPWWNKLKFWIWYCYPKSIGDIPQDDKYLLHAAASNADVPPHVIRLLLAVYPDSAKLPVLGVNNLPLHLASATMPYEPELFEVFDIDTNSLELIVQAYPEAASIRSASGYPIDIAIAHERTKDEIPPLMDVVPATLDLDSSDNDSLSENAYDAMENNSEFDYEEQHRAFQKDLENELREAKQAGMDEETPEENFDDEMVDTDYEDG